MDRYLTQVQNLIPRAYDPRHVLALMLVGRPNFAHMSDQRFAAECTSAMDCVDLVGTEVAEQSAQRWKL